MWILQTGSGKNYCGLFSTEEAAKVWANTLIPELKAKPVELLLDPDMEQFLIDEQVSTPINMNNNGLTLN